MLVERELESFVPDAQLRVIAARRRRTRTDGAAGGAAPGREARRPGRHVGQRVLTAQPVGTRAATTEEV